jgi:hypothetical protein
VGDRTFSDLPAVTSEEALRRAHRVVGLFVVRQGGVAHCAPMTCPHLEDSVLVGRSKFRVATDVEVHKLGISWCQDCCE